MKNHRFGVIAICALTASALVAGMVAAASSAAAAKPFAFTAKYAGAAVVRVDENVAYITSNGAGKGTLLGAARSRARGPATQPRSRASRSPAPARSPAWRRRS